MVVSGELKELHQSKSQAARERRKEKECLPARAERDSLLDQERRNPKLPSRWRKGDTPGGDEQADPKKYSAGNPGVLSSRAIKISGPRAKNTLAAAADHLRRKPFLLRQSALYIIRATRATRATNETACVPRVGHFY
jgi:hypothetical protein